MLFIGLDDTDSPDSRGTGHLARQIARALSSDHQVLGVTRHQLLIDPRVPYTRKNSCAAILLDGQNRPDPAAILERVRGLMMEDFIPGSDPGLCVAAAVPAAITAFGRRTQRDLATRAEAQTLAAHHDIPLVGLGGDHSGVIGALAAVGLAASGEDGRYVQVGRSREMSGPQPISAVLAAGVAIIQTIQGQAVTEGLIQADRLRPARRGGRPVLFVERAAGHWQPVKVD